MAYTYSDTFRPNIIHVNVPMFIRLLELAREELESDANIHLIAEAAIFLSSQHVITMKDYPAILKSFTKA
jgi:hypothetical protein